MGRGCERGKQIGGENTGRLWLKRGREIGRVKHKRERGERAIKRTRKEEGHVSWAVPSGGEKGRTTIYPKVAKLGLGYYESPPGRGGGKKNQDVLTGKG